MNDNDNYNAQPLRELEWLVHYFKEHCREDLAQEIFRQIKSVRHKAQDSLKDDASDVIDFGKNKRRKSGS